ncbi:VCBS repeat-containing protein [Novosphingobium kunmingense]|uniref:VCBS repeat-containing protein n=1 Tax=Novosphingobium kunmingense TaxID=1211806 RepID=A0A2N0H764_9SPHN|nr:VCBS domain-containing protein [Novosphingobium kunmingense]PKB14767.1 VCBS repeat-containing protein [Novosphingobium kunmingense]
MGTQITGAGGTTTSFSNTPQATCDSYTYSEDDLLDRPELYNQTFDILTLDVMANDLGGKAKTLFSIDDGFGNALDVSQTDLLSKDTNSCWEKTALGNQIRIINGKVEFQLRDSAGNVVDVNSLSAGQTISDSFTYAIKLGNGTLSWARVNVTLTGSNDGPDIELVGSDSAVANLAETNAGLSTSGTLTVKDPDTGDTVTAAVDSVTASGTGGTNFTNAALKAMLSVTAGPVAADGELHNLTWTFNSGGEAFNYLAAGESLVLTYSIKASDSAPGDLKKSDVQTVAVTINGTNDAPDIAVQSGDSASAGLTEGNAGLSTSGTLTVIDPDTSDSVSATVQSVSADGPGAAGLDNAALKAMLSVTAGPIAADAGSSHNLGWSFASGGQAFNFLAAGEQLVLTYTIAVGDGHGGSDTQTVTVTITGTNDAATITGDTGGNVVEDTALSTAVSGTLTVADVDNGEAVFQVPAAAALAGDYGAFTFVPATGAWTFTLDNTKPATQALAKDQIATQSLTVTSFDGTASETIAVTITGTNDSPVIGVASDSVAAVSEGDDGSSQSDSGQMTATDVDHGATQAWSISAQAALGTATIDADGYWTYATVDSGVVDALAVGQTLGDVFTVQVADGKGGFDTKQVQVTIAGTNDGPEIRQLGGDTVADTVAETNAGLNVTGKVSVIDVDTLDTVTASVTAVSLTGDKTDKVAATAALDMMTVTDGTIAANAGDSNNLTWTFNSGTQAFDFLAVGQSLTLTYTIRVEDGHGGFDEQLVSVTVTGTNDGPVGSASEILALGTEDTPYVVTAAQLLQGFGDVDGDSLTVANLVADHGSVTANPDGSFTITPTANYNGPVILTYTVSDGHGASIGGTQNFSLTAVTDLSAGHDSFSGTEDTQLSGSVAGNDSTTSGGMLTYAVATGPANGTLSFNTDGSFTYNPAPNSSGPDSFTYTVTDAAADESATRTVDLSIAAVNDPAVIGGNTARAIVEDAVPNTVSGDLDSADVDNPSDSWTVVSSPTVSVNGYGTYTIDATGHWTFTLDNTSTQVQQLTATQSLTDTFTVATVDGTQQQVTVTIKGANDPATIGGTLTDSVAEAGALSAGNSTAGGTLTIADVDSGEAKFAAPATLVGSYGTFTFNTASGAWTYQLDNARAATQALTQGQIVYDYLNVGSFDGTANDQVYVKILGANDAAVIGGALTGSVTEATPSNTGVPTATGDLNSTDVDGANDAWTAIAVPVTTATGYGSYVIDSTGHWTYTLNNANPVIEALNTGDTRFDSFTVTTADGTSATIAITINGRTDVSAIPPPTVYSGIGDSNDKDGFTTGAVPYSTLGNNDLGGNNVVYGTAGNDVIDVKAGTDTVYSWGGTDTVIGGSGGDTIYGGTGDDTIFGDAGSDKLYGGSGNDTVIGDQDDDLILGGFGADTLTGNQGNDIFQFIDLHDTNDTITDFNHANDTLNFALLDINDGQAGVQKFAYHGTTATAYGLWHQVIGGNTVIYGDTDGILTTAEFMITLTGNNLGLDATDFAFV